MSAEQLQALCSGAFTACDISDALLKLKVPHAGFLVDIDLKHAGSTRGFVAAPATTVLFALKASTEPPSISGHFADNASAPGTIAVLSAPAGTRCAVLGGLVAARLAKRGVRGVVVGGRVRDLSEMELGDEWQVWAQGTSTVGAGAETRCVGIDVDIEVAGVMVKAEDIVVMDQTAGGVVVIPKDKVAEVLELMPKAVEADMLVGEDVQAGMELGASMKSRRG